MIIRIWPRCALACHSGIARLTRALRLSELSSVIDSLSQNNCKTKKKTKTGSSVGVGAEVEEEVEEEEEGKK